MKNRHDIAVVGCGTAGQASALLLTALGHRVTIFERAMTLGPVGAGLLLQPTGMAVLKRLGAAEEIAGLSNRVERLLGTTRGGRPVLDISYRDIGESVHGWGHGWGTHRGALFMGLQRLVERAGVGVRLGVECAIIRPSGAKRTIYDSRNQRHGPFDLVVVADGSRSGLARRSGLVRRAKQYPWGALWFVADDPQDVYSGVLRQVYRGTREMIGFLPSGRAREGGAATVSVFWSIRCADRERVFRAGVEAWKESVRGLTPLAEPLLEQVRSMDQLIFASYCDTVMRRWDDGPVVYIGDAGHAMSPQLGQGANLALVDASVLAECVGGGESIPLATAMYTARRRKHLRFYQFASRRLTPMFQSDWPLVGLARDLLMGPACRWEWGKRKMLETLVGVKTGVFSNMAEAELATTTAAPPR